MRMRGHAEHDDMKYVPKEQVEAWAQKDPIARYEQQLLAAGIAAEELQAVVAKIEALLQAELLAAEASPFPEPRDGLSGVYGDRETKDPTPPLVCEREKRGKR
jgi:TPP-dependent pyruvate/acetoin dehydrogenase alpha subunit